MSENSKFLEIIKSRTSMREYTSQPIENELLEEIIKCGMAAPSGKNGEVWEFLVIKNRETLASMSQALPNAKMMAGAAAVVVLCCDKRKIFEGDFSLLWIEDLCAATQNMLLAAHSLGIGAVWTGIYPIEQRLENVNKILDLPPHIIPFNSVVLGYPAIDKEPKNKWKPERIHYEKF